MNAAHQATLITLLAERLPRRRRCGSCIAFVADDPDPDGSVYGDCEANVQPGSYYEENDRCTLWEPIAWEWFEEQGG